MTILLDQRWYTSQVAVAKARARKLAGKPHLTPEGLAVLVCDYVGPGLVALVMQGADGHDLMTRDGHRVAFDPSALPDLDRLVEFDHLPESRKVTSWMKPGAKLA